MGIKQLYRGSPSPGQVLQEVRNMSKDDGFEEFRGLTANLKDQKEIAESKLNLFLENLSSSPGAKKVIRTYYTEKYGKDIDASDAEILKKEVPNIDSILYNGALPVVSKDDLRNHFEVEGAWENDNSNKEVPYLSPTWVRENNDEPYRIFETSGTTGGPWEVVTTRNDWGMMLVQGIRVFDELLRQNDIIADNTNAAVVFPDESGPKAFFSETLAHLGANVRKANLQKIISGGDESVREAEKLINHVNSGEYGVVLAPVKNLLQGKFGVEIRRGSVDPDLYVNAGLPLAGNNIQSIGSEKLIEDFYGETEYPQVGGRKISVDGKSGYELPLNSQINLIYDTSTGELDYEGVGRFAYLPFGTEGHTIPGVYVSGVRAEIEIMDNKQLLKNVTRVEDTDRGCYQELY